jgi:hypothetical protein
LANPSRHLKPAKPGEIRNPEGRNQYTYRREAEKHLDEWCREYGRDLIRVICAEAKARKPWAAKLMLDRILPAVTQHEVAVTEPADLDDLLARVDQIRATKRGNGHDRDARPSGSNGSDGGAA